MTGSNPQIKHIIFAEDDEDDRLFFEDVIRNYNPSMRIDFVSNGVQLMEILPSFLPDLLFLDLEMPYKNGLECLLEIRNNVRLNQLPVIVFSSTTRQANIQTAYEVGAHLFLIKSPTYSEYAGSIKAALSLDWSNPDHIKEQYCVNGRYTSFS
jgi:CheY-like chemotaxis protein